MGLCCGAKSVKEANSLTGPRDGSVTCGKSRNIYSFELQNVGISPMVKDMTIWFILQLAF